MSKENFIKSTQIKIDKTLKFLLKNHPHTLPSSNNIEENIYYVNGIRTDTKKGNKNNDIIRRYFGLTSPPVLIFNDTEGFAKDIAEGAKDYAWGIKFALKGENHDPLPHEVSFGILAMLQAAKNENKPIGISASSQGALITTNCLLAFWYLNDENKRFLKKMVRVCNVGTVVHKLMPIFLFRILNKYVTAVNPKDPVAMYVGMHRILDPFIIPRLIANKLDKYHGIEWYLPVDKHVVDYYDKKGKYDKYEPFVKKDFFINPVLLTNPHEVNYSSNKNKWLEPFLNIMMQS